MASLRLALLTLTALSLAWPAEAQFFFRRQPQQQVGPPPGTPPHEAAIWPFPAPDPGSWWEDKWPKASEAADPLGGRRIRRGERLPAGVDIDASTYRLWGLMPLQWQLLRGDEMVLEVWRRPSASVRQTVTRIVIRGGDEAFVQARAGLACCEAGIGRRVGFDVELPPGSAARFLALREAPIWNAPRDVRVQEAGTTTAVCVEGTAYDLILATPGRVRSIRRACDLAEVGQAADVLEAVLGAALGHEPRYDIVFRNRVDFSAARGAYRDLIETGGRLMPAPNARPQPPGLEPQPEVAAEAPAEQPSP